jgi:hypothetical protein
VTKIGDVVVCGDHWDNVLAGSQPATIYGDDRALAVALYTREHHIWTMTCGHYFVEGPK